MLMVEKKDFGFLVEFTRQLYFFILNLTLTFLSP